MEEIKSINNSFSKFVIDATGYSFKTRRFRNLEEFYLHDPLAVGVLIDPSLVKKQKLPIHVETQEGERYGETLEMSDGATIEVCLEVDAQRFLDLFLSRLS